MSKFMDLLDDAHSEKEKDQILKRGVRTVLNESLKKDWSARLKKDYGISKRQGIEAKIQLVDVLKITAIVAAISLFIIAYQNINQKDPLSLAMEYIENDHLSHHGVIKGIQDEKVDHQQLAIQAYRSKNYEEAGKLFTKMNNKTSHDSLFLAISLIKSKDYNSSIGLLQPLSHKDHLLYQEAIWHLGLSYIMTGKYSEAKKTLNSISHGNYKFSEAQKLLKVLSSN